MGWIDQRLSLRKGAQTHGAATDVPLNTLELAGRTQSPHGLNHGIEQAQEKEREVLSVFELALGIPKRGMQLFVRHAPGQDSAKLGKQIPLLEMFFGNLELGVIHRVSGPAWAKKYKLQTR